MIDPCSLYCGLFDPRRYGMAPPKQQAAAEPAEPPVLDVEAQVEDDLSAIAAALAQLGVKPR